MSEPNDNKDSIPRVGVGQLFDVLGLVASTNHCTFELVRALLCKTAKRKAPPSREAMWTVARDVLSDLQRLGFLRAGALPRKRSEVNRLRETPCEITDNGAELAQLHQEKKEKAFDKLLISWINGHLYFRAFTARLLLSPMFVPDITSIKQLGKDLSFPLDPKALVKKINESCISRLAVTNFPAEKATIFSAAVEDRVLRLSSAKALANIDAKKLMDTIEDNVVVPAILESENLHFDAVTLQHLLGCARDFYSASVTSSHPSFIGRVFFSTCDFSPDIGKDPITNVSDVIHHGRSFASDRFVASVVSSYKQLAGTSSNYVDIYALRAQVSVDLRIQPSVFAICLEQIIDGNIKAGVSIYTELPFNPPPQGESYVEIRKRRIGLLKLSFSDGG
jgi:hypothetical protein